MHPKKKIKKKNSELYLHLGPGRKTRFGRIQPHIINMQHALACGFAADADAVTPTTIARRSP